MKFQKKGQAFFPPSKLLFWIMYIIIAGVAAVTLTSIAFDLGSQQTRIRENLESLYLTQRFLKSPDCFTHSNGDVVARGVIDIKKFTDENLNKCYKIPPAAFPAFRLNLKSDTGQISSTIQTQNWNGNREPEIKMTPRNARILSNEKIQNGVMVVEIQNAR